jgi:hypothetical protein
MKKLKTFPFLALVFCAILVTSLFISCEMSQELAVTLPPPETPQPSVESVIGDISIVYPVVPDEGKEAGRVTMPVQPSPSAQSVIGDVSIVYPVVPDNGKEAGRVTLSTPAVQSVIGDVGVVYPVVPDEGKKTTPVQSPGPLPAPAVTYIIELRFIATDPVTEQLGSKSYGEVFLKVKSAYKDVVKVSLTGPATNSVVAPPWHEVNVEQNGEGITSWKVLGPGEYTATGMLLNPQAHDFTCKLKVH